MRSRTPRCRSSPQQEIGVALLIGGTKSSPKAYWRDPGPRPPHGRCHPAPRLSADPGHRAVVQLRLRPGEPRRRPRLHAARPEDPLLSAPDTIGAIIAAPPLATPATFAAAPTLPDITIPPVRARRGFVGFLRRHPAVAIGGALVLAMILMALLAPFLGTVDPTAIATSRRTRAPSAAYWFGTDMFGRDIYSRVVYGARLSSPSPSASPGRAQRIRRRPRHRPRRRLRALARRHRHAGDGQHERSIPTGAARYRADGADPRQRRQRHHGDRARRIPPRLPPRAQRRAHTAASNLERSTPRSPPAPARR